MLILQHSTARPIL